MPETELIGRDDAVSALEARLAALPRHGSALAVRGESGSGRSALLALAARRARARGYGALDAAALHARPGGDTLRDGAAVLDRLRASPTPVVLLLDDVERLDERTRAVAVFVARRCEAARVLVIAALRERTRVDFPTLHLEPLSTAAAGALLDREAPGLPRPLRRRVLEDAQGNPLALLELAAAGGDALRALTEPWPALSERLVGSLADALPEPAPATRAALLVAAIEPQAPLAVVLDVAAVTPEALEAAASIAEVRDGRLCFRRNVVRAWVAQTAAPDERAAVHAGLAARLGEPLAAWHRAAAASEPSEPLAAALEATAGRARARGELVTAAAGFARAAELSERADQRALRLAATAACAFDLGLAEAARRLLARAEALELGRATRVLLRCQTPRTRMPATALAEAIALIAAVDEHRDRDAALSALMQLALDHWLGGVGAEDRLAFVEAAERLDPDDPRTLAVRALADPDRSTTTVAARLATLRAEDVNDPLAALQLAIAANAVNDWRHARRLLAPAIAQLRRQRRDGVLAAALAHHAWATLHTGDWAFAESAAREARGLATETGRERSGVAAQLTLALVAALRGDEGNDEITRATALSDASPAVRGAVRHVHATLALGGGRFEDARRELVAAFDPANPTFRRSYRGGWVLLDLVEAAARSGDLETARAVLEAFEPVTGPGDSLLAACAVASRPLIADDREAEARFEAALAHDLSGWPYVRARTLLAYGRWLRGRRRGGEAVPLLRAACDEFDMLGARRFSDRARDELRALGATHGAPAPRTPVELTAQERLIAELAAGGMTNQQIADRLVLSHRTIGSHLYQIFPKLGISSRAQLRAALEDGG